MSRLRYRFILNPFSGLGRKQTIPTLLDSHLDKDKIEHELILTTHAGHARELAAEAVSQGVDAVIAIGGDGSVNEVGSALIGTETALGIIAAGSGNGLARSFGIPIDTIEAIQHLNTATAVRIDTGRINERAFIGIAGLGFGATVSQRFVGRKLRGFIGYIPVVLESYRQHRLFSYRLDNEEEEKEAFVMEFANTTDYGNNAKIAPMAEYNDGYLEWVRISKMPAWRVPRTLARLFDGSLPDSDLVTHGRIKAITLHHTADIAHVDGEPFEVDSKVTIRIVPDSLKVLAG